MLNQVPTPAVGSTPDPTHFLPGAWSDGLALFGAFGTLATLIALVIAVHQIKAAVTVGRAVKEAVDGTLRKYRLAFSRYTAGTAQRFLRETELFVRERRWPEASARCRDLAEVLHSLAVARNESDGALGSLATKCNQWAAQFGQTTPGEELARGAQAKWQKIAWSVTTELGAVTNPAAERAAGGERE